VNATAATTPAVDSNVVVRIFARDDAVQLEAARRAVEGGVWVGVTVILEAIWVCQSVYGTDRHTLSGQILALASMPTVTVERTEAVRWAAEQYRGGADFADALHVALAGERMAFMTFDRALVRKLQPDTEIDLIDLAQAASLPTTT
jgi:predicted nucleic-acid-binding protein